MNNSLIELLARRRDRAIATILNVKERECDEHLPAHARAALRKVVLDTVNDFYDVCIDVAKSLDNDSVVVNQAYIERKLDEIYEAVNGSD